MRPILEGDSFTIDEERRGEVIFDIPDRRKAPPEETQGEPWGWIKPGLRPRGWPGPEPNPDDPGPYDGEWEPLR